jgi:hypothetical protein
MKKIYLLLVSISLTLCIPLNAQHLESAQLRIKGHPNKPILEHGQDVDDDDLWNKDHYYSPLMNFTMRSDLTAAVVDTYNFYLVIDGVSRLHSETVPVYNEENIITSIFSKTYDYDTGFFGYSDNMRFKYDDQGRAVEDTVYTYRRSTGQWILSDLYTRSYNDMNEIDTMRSYVWNNVSRQWRLDRYTFFTYNENSQITSFTTYLWYPIIQSFEKISETIYEYDQLFRFTKQTNYRLLGASLQITYESHTVYSANGDQSVQTTYSRSFSNVPLIPNRQFLTKYNEHGSVLERETSLFNGNVNNVPTWRPLTKQQFTYNEDQFQIENRTSQWNISLNRYTLDQIMELNYDEYGNMIHSETFKVNSAGETSLDLEETVDLDYNFQKDEVIYPYSGLNAYSHKAKDVIVYDHTNQRIDLRREYIWRELTTSTKEKTATTSEVKLFPNPVMGVLIMKTDALKGTYDHVTITDLYGRLVYRSTFDGDLRLPMHHWSPGSYIAIFSNSQHGSVESHRFIKM